MISSREHRLEPARSESLFQQRVTQLALWSTALNGFRATYFLVRALLVKEPLETWVFWMTIAAAAVSAGVWLIVRTAVKGERLLQSVEVIGFLLVESVFISTYANVSAVGRPDLQMALAAFLGLVVRSIYIPSSPQRTTLITAILALPLVASTYRIYHRITPAAFAVLHGTYHQLMGEEGHRALSAEVFARAAAVNMAVLWVICGGVGVATSIVVQGLRREIERSQVAARS
jgi:hypothetical protein